MKHKASHHRKKRRHHRRRGHLGAVSVSAIRKHPMVQNVEQDVKDAVSAVGGIFLGNLGARALNHVLKVDESSSMIKKAIAPIATTAVGIGLAVYGSTGKQDGIKRALKFGGLGMIGSGVNQGAKLVFKKNLLEGVTDDDGTVGASGKAIEAKVFRETIDQIKQLRESNNIQPELPGMKGTYHSEEERLQEQDALLGNDNDADEIS